MDSDEREQGGSKTQDELCAKLRRGIEQADRGEFFDGEAVFEEIRELSARRRAEKKE